MSTLSGLRLTHRGTIHTALTCNCLLPGVVSPQPVDSASATRTDFFAAFYQLHSQAGSGSASEDVDASAKYSGDVVRLEWSDTPTSASAASPELLHTSCGTSTTTAAATVAVRASQHDPLLSQSTFPGVFDLGPLPQGVRVPIAGLSSSPPCTPLLIAACTDGSARLLDANTLNTYHTFASVHDEMLTSVTPIFAQGDSTTDVRLEQLLCTAHTGAVLVYDVARSEVIQTLDGHDFDAWCGAVRLENDAVLGSGARRLFSGGDDGFLRLYDTHADNASVGRMRFEAGVVSISPVAHTPYILVGSYAETLALVDERFLKRPVAECTGLGGGVWRTNRFLPVPHAARGEVAGVLPYGYVPRAGQLLLPLMQRGAALIGYDTQKSAAEVFSAPRYCHAEAAPSNGDEDMASWAPGSTCGTLTEALLVYDTAVLGVSEDGAVVDVASGSFYEKRIDLWRIERV